jgi:NADH:ubiquinone oxidoreductase subunit 3 (subunit A)
MGGTAQYLHAGFILISVANLIVIALLIVVFVLAVTLRRPEKSRISTLEAAPETAGTAGKEAANAEVRP